MYVQLGSLTIALVVVVLFLVFDFSAAPAHRSRIDQQGSSPFLGRLPLEVAYWAFTPLARLVNALEISPNTVSWTCLALGSAAAIAAAAGAIVLAGSLILASAVFDMLDGMVARSRGLASDAGEVLDAAVDRYTEFLFLAGMTIYYRDRLWAMALVQAALVGSMLVSYSQAKAEAMHVTTTRSWMRRPERAVYLGGGAFLSPIVTAWLEPGRLHPVHYSFLGAVLLVAVLSNADAIHRFVTLYRAVKEPADTGL